MMSFFYCTMDGKKCFGLLPSSPYIFKLCYRLRRRVPEPRATLKQTAVRRFSVSVARLAARTRVYARTLFRRRLHQAPTRRRRRRLRVLELRAMLKGTAVRRFSVSVARLAARTRVYARSLFRRRLLRLLHPHPHPFLHLPHHHHHPSRSHSTAIRSVRTCVRSSSL